MRKFTVALLMSFLLITTTDLLAQEMTSKEITNYITQHKWFLRRYEMSPQYFTVPKEHQGNYMVFLPHGKVYYYKDGENESNRPRYDWKLSGTNKITLTIHDGTKNTFSFKLKDFIGYNIYITQNGGDMDGLTYVWEDAGEAVSVPEEKKVDAILKKTNNDQKTVTIGNTIWMTENLNTTRFRNGDIIPETQTAADWKKAGELGQPAWCYYDNNPKNGEKYGKLYNWYAISDQRGLAPTGYRVAAFDEWYTIGKFSHFEAGGKLKATYYWDSPNTGATNSSGFSAVPGGYRNDEGGFTSLGTNANWWTKDGFDVRARFISLRSYDSNLGNGILNKSYGHSIRCVKE